MKIRQIISLFKSLEQTNKNIAKHYIKQSHDRTRKILTDKYNYIKDNNPNLSEKKLFENVIRKSFKISNKRLGDKHHSLTEKELYEITEKTTDIDNLVDIIISKRLVPNQ